MSYEQYGQVSDFASAASLANGVYVEIKGTQGSNGVFVASKVDIKNHSSD